MQTSTPVNPSSSRAIQQPTTGEIKTRSSSTTDASLLPGAGTSAGTIAGVVAGSVGMDPKP